MAKVKYEFQGLLHDAGNGEVTGPMSPVEAAKLLAKDISLPLSGLMRVVNNQADSHSYDHLVILSKFKVGIIVWLMVDFGTGVIPCASLYYDDEFMMTPVYKTELAKRDYHLSNLEAPKRCKENPIMDLDEDGFRELFKQALDSGEFEVKKEE